MTLSTIILVEFNDEILVEYSIDIENGDAFEKELEEDEETEKISFSQDYFASNSNKKTYYILNEGNSKFFESILSPPPECL